MFGGVCCMPVNLPSVERHTIAIQKIINKPACSTIKKLSSEDFWKTLKERIQDNAEFQKIYTYWKSIELLAHLNTSDLLNLLETHILPLQRGYDYWLADLPGEETRLQIEDNIQSLSKLKLQVFEALFLRCSVYKHLNSTRHCDDVIQVVLNAINNTKALPKFLKKSTGITYKIDDDQRLTIYDYLKHAAYDDQQLIDNITSPIPKRRHVARHEYSQPEKKINQAREFRMSFNRQLKLNNPIVQWLGSFNLNVNFLLDPLKARLGFWFVFLQKGRYLLYFSISLLSYYCALQLLSPVVLMFFGVNALGVVSNSLFYSLGIAPVWLWGWQSGATLWSKAYDFILARKKQNIFDSLILLENTTHFIYEKLHSTIVDISHFNINQLQSRGSEILHELKHAKNNLENYSVLEMLLCSKELKAHVNSAVTKINEAEKKLRSSLRKVAKHIASTIGDEIEYLEHGLNKKKLLGSLPAKQIQDYNRFIKRFGNRIIYVEFLKNVNPITRWSQKLIDSAFISLKEKFNGELDKPWGTHVCQKQLLKGWDLILESFTLDQELLRNCHELSQVLQGKKSISLVRFNHLVNSMKLGEQQKLFINAFQNTLYQTLDAKLASNAHLLGESHKKTLSEWYQKNLTNIISANHYFNEFIKSNSSKNVDTKLLVECFELLDAEDLYLYSIGTIHNASQRRNRIRDLIEKYDGNAENNVYRFIRFIPDCERSKLITKIARARLNYLLNNQSVNDTLNSTDRELFHNPALDKKKFDFTAVLSEKRYQISESFINECRDNLLSPELDLRYTRMRTNG